MKKSLALLMSVLMTLSLTSCTGQPSGSTPNNTDIPDADKTYSVGIVQLMQHVALDEATKGFQDALTDKLGDKVSFDVKVASGEQTNCSAIVSKFINDGADLIMANATPAVIAAKEATSTIPSSAHLSPTMCPKRPPLWSPTRRPAPMLPATLISATLPPTWI